MRLGRAKKQHLKLIDILSLRLFALITVNSTGNSIARRDICSYSLDGTL